MNSPIRKQRSTEKITKLCMHCNSSFIVPNYRKETSKFCYRSCGALYVRKEIIADCVICGRKFTHISSRANKAKYCSRECYHIAQSYNGRTIFTCQHCNKKFKGPKSTNRKFCSKRCVNKANKETWKPSFSTARKSMIARGMISKCEKCGYNKEPKILGVHHKDENRNNNELSNLIVLCPTCHSLEHVKHIPH